MLTIRLPPRQHEPDHTNQEPAFPAWQIKNIKWANRQHELHHTDQESLSAPKHLHRQVGSGNPSDMRTTKHKAGLVLELPYRTRSRQARTHHSLQDEHGQLGVGGNLRFESRISAHLQIQEHRATSGKKAEMWVTYEEEQYREETVKKACAAFD